MSLEQANTVDAIGVEIETDHAVLTIADSWDWREEHEHLLALQEKLHAYFAFIESGEIFDSYPAAQGRQLKINIVFRQTPPVAAIEFLSKGFERCLWARRAYYPSSF